MLFQCYQSRHFLAKEQRVSDSPGIDSSGEIVEILSGSSFPDRQKPDMEITPCPSFPHSSTTDPQAHTDSLVIENHTVPLLFDTGTSTAQ